MRDILQKIVDKFYNKEPISQNEIAFVVGVCAGRLDENQKLKEENKRLLLENGELRTKAASQPLAGNG